MRPPAPPRPPPLLRRAPPLSRIATRHPVPSSLAAAATPPDPADWERSPEWYGSQGGGWGRGPGATVFAAPSPVGNGAVTVTAHPASAAPTNAAVASTEWRVLRFGEATRQSVALVEVERGRKGGTALPSLACPAPLPAARPDALAFEYVKTVVASCAAALGRMPAPLLDAAVKKAGGGPGGPSILCIGVGGGTIPLALASLFPGAAVTGVDLCPAVLGAADAMGLTAAAERHAHGNLALALGDGVAALEGWQPRGGLDLLVVDAFDGSDAVPPPLATPGGTGLMAATSALHPGHGAVVMNLHAGPKPGPGDWLGRRFGGGGATPAPPTFVVRPDGSGPGAAALATARAWAAALLPPGAGGEAWMVGVRRQANAAAVVARGRGECGGAQAVAAAALAATRRAAITLPFDVGDRAGYGFFDVRRL